MTESVIQLPTAGEPVFDTFDRICRRGPVVPIELPGNVSAWIAVSYQAVSEILAADGTVFSKNARNCPALHDGTIPADWPMRAFTDIDHMLNMDGADHRRLKKTIGQAFSPARVAALEPRIGRIVTELIDDIPDPSGEVDLVEDVTMPFPGNCGSRYSNRAPRIGRCDRTRLYVPHATCSPGPDRPRPSARWRHTAG
ncbi:hypothetical protein [Nocardia amamiensis]|uniref:hypothetical protein n=1 Tax=Nocardia amamiensis TaxID=404578 RepID=UPI000833490E|nr:hypothetical protein [Nocardia amamiensis]